jgi:hypothetical protein
VSKEEPQDGPDADDAEDEAVEAPAGEPFLEEEERADADADTSAGAGAASRPTIVATFDL